MLSKAGRQSLIWGSVLILIGVLLVMDLYIELSPWVWAGVLAAAGLAAFGLYFTDRSDKSMLLATYVLWTIALLVIFVTLDILRDDAIAFYVLVVIALPFLAVFLLNRAQWWALIPAYVLLAIALMLGLTELGILDDLLIPAYVLFTIAIPFFVVYARDRKLWWALIPGGVLAIIGIAFLIAEAAFEYIGALVLILIGLGILARGFIRREPSGQAGPPDEGIAGADAEE